MTAKLVTLDTGKQIVFKDEQAVSYSLEKIAETRFECRYDDVEHDEHIFYSGFMLDTNTGAIRHFVEARCIDADVELNEVDVLYYSVDDVEFVG